MSLAVYVRVSTQRQAQAQTIEQQLEWLCHHCQAYGWELPADHIFRDDGYSGASLNRPGLDRLRDAVRAAEVDRVLVTAPDRLARNYVHQMVLLEELERYGCQVEFLEHPMSQDPHDQLLLQIRAVGAEYERTLIAERMRRGRQRKLQAGVLLPWTHPPYGYQLDPERPRDPAGVTRVPAEAAVVQELFTRYADESVSLRGLANQLWASGLPSPTGRPRWSPATLRGILSNPTYTGHVYAGRTQSRVSQRRQSALQPVSREGRSHEPSATEQWRPVATIPALVTPEQFERVQAKLAQNQQCALRNNKVHTYLLRTLVSCGVCHLSCLGRTIAPGYDYYICRGKAHSLYSGREEKCPARYTPAHQLDALVWQDLCDVLTHPESIRYALERAQGGTGYPKNSRHGRNSYGRVGATWSSNWNG